MDDWTCYCRHPKCVLYGQMVPRTWLKSRGWHRNVARFQWQACGALVAARPGTAYASLRTDATTYLRGATALAEGLSLRATGRLLDVDKDPGNHGLPVLGQHCQNVMHYFFRNLHLHACQLDELWTFIGSVANFLCSSFRL
jgi:hypothetical protein